MGSDKQNNENPPASTFPLQKDDEFVSSVRQNEAAFCTGIFHYGNGAETDPCSYMPLPVAPFSWKNMHSSHQSYAHDISETGGNLMADFTRLNSLQNPQTDPNFINIRSKVPSLYRPVPDFPCPEGSMKGVWPSHSCNNMVTADNLLKSSGHFNSRQNPVVNRNFTLIKGNAGGSYQMTRQGGQANSSNIHGPQINRNFVGLGGSTPMLYHTQNSGEIGIDNNVCSPEKIDGSFLTLGIGGSTEARSKFDLNSGQITNKSDEAGSSQLHTSHVRQAAARSSSNLGHNLAGGFSSFQNNFGGFSSLTQNAGGCASSNNDVGIICGTNAALTSSPFHILQKPQVDMQHYFPMPGNRNLGFVGNRDARYEHLGPHKGFLGDLAASSGPFSSSSTGLLDSGQTGLSGLASEFAKPTQITTKPTSDQQQKCYMETVQNFPLESSKDSPFVGIRGSSTMQDHSGKLFPATEASASQAESSQFLRRIGVQPDGQLFSAHNGTAGGLGVQVRECHAAQAAGVSVFPKRLGVRVNEGSAAQAAGGGLLPKRRGVQVAEGSAAQAAECGLYPKGIGVESLQTASKLGRPQGRVPVQFPKHLLEPAFAAGRPPHNVPFQFPIDLRGPSSASGRSQGVPVHFSKDLLGPVSTTGQVIPIAKGDGFSQASNVLGVPSLKRSAVRPPPAAPWAQCRNIKVKHSACPYMPSPQLTAPAAPIPIPMPGASIPQPAVAPHIKWPGFDGTPQTTGQKCLLCKRDLSFKPEGPVYQPTVPPPVAVLPCGHTFHDHCLQIITPEDQSKNPPCIPCAIGEI